MISSAVDTGEDQDIYRDRCECDCHEPAEYQVEWDEDGETIWDIP